MAHLRARQSTAASTARRGRAVATGEKPSGTTHPRGRCCAVVAVCAGGGGVCTVAAAAALAAQLVDVSPNASTLHDVGGSQSIASLPAGWQEVFDPVSGQLYFHNGDTGEVTWTRPAFPSSAPRHV